MNDLPDEFQTQLKTLLPATVSRDAYAKILEKLQTPSKPLANWTMLFAAIATAACVAIAILLVNRTAMEKSYKRQLAQKDSLIEDERRQNAAATQRTIDDHINSVRTSRLSPAVSVARFEGSIVAVESDLWVFINVGLADHISPGLTFEVYAKDEGVPSIGDGLRADDMPIGIASIEVDQVRADVSQCRVVKLQPGRRIAQGDRITNLVYSENGQRSFVIYGKFDLNQTGHPNLADADTLRSLVQKWGGKVQDKIDIDTDVVVMGAKPDLDQLLVKEKSDPSRLKDFQDQIAEYEKIVDRAHDLHIPIVNQDRFLHFCGFYDMAMR